MRLRQLFENKENNVAIIFGRFNPPHFGHVDAWLEAAKFPIWYVGTNQSTQGPKDPLPFDIKIEAMKTMYPEIEEHLVAEQSWFTLAAMVYKRHGENTILQIVTDPLDKDIYVPMIQKQNGLEGPHGYYKFVDIQWHKADRKSEASLVRKAVKENNPKDFEKYSGVPANTVVAGQPYFQLVRKYMLPYMQAEEEKLKKQQERDRLKAEKEQTKVAKKVKQPEQGVAEDDSPAMAQAARRLTDPNDGKTAKLRAAGDKRRDDQLKGRDIANRDRTSKDEWGDFKKNLAELSSDMLGRYKKAASTDASKADKEGDFKRGDKRFSGIVKATKKQFDNDTKDKK